MDEKSSVTSAQADTTAVWGGTCGGTQSPWPGYPVSSFQSPTRMAAWTEVSHKDSEVWCFSRGPAGDLGSAVSEWDMFWFSNNVHLELGGNRVSLGPGGAGLDWTWLWLCDADRLDFDFSCLAGDIGDSDGDPLGRDTRRGL